MTDVLHCAVRRNPEPERRGLGWRFACFASAGLGICWSRVGPWSGTEERMLVEERILQVQSGGMIGDCLTRFAKRVCPESDIRQSSPPIQ